MTALNAPAASHRYTLPAVVAATMLAITMGGWYVLEREVAHENQAHFTALVSEAQHNLADRLSDYRNLLEAGRGLFSASKSVEREEWRAFVNSLHLADRYPGILAMSFVANVPANTVDTFSATIRADGCADFQISPPGHRDKYFPVIYIEPEDGNRSAIGFDLACEPVRRAAAVKARDSGEPTISGVVKLVQDPQQRPSLLLYVPVYVNNQAHGSLEERRNSLLGWIGAPLIAPETLRMPSPQDEEITFRIQDEGFDILYDGIGIHPGLFHATRELPICGRTWTITYTSTSGFKTSAASHEPWLALIVGIALTVAFTGLLTNVQTTRDRAVAIAEVHTRALRISEGRWQAALDGAQDGIWDWNLITNEVFYSRRWKEMLGYAEHDIADLLDNWKTLVHPDDLLRAMAALADHFAGKGTYAVEFRMRAKDGGWRWILSRGRAHFNAAGQPVRITGSHTDITERKLSETRLQTSEEKFRALFETAPVGMALHRQDGTLVQANRAYLDIIGYGEHDYRHLTRSDITPRMFDQTDAAQIEILERVGRYGPYEKQYRRKNGDLVPVRLNGMYLITADGSKLICLFAEDITASKNGEDQLRQARDAAESANRAKGHFLATMSHEIRTPLNGVVGMTRLLMNTPLSGMQKEYANVLLTSTDNLMSLINDILDFSKIEANRLELEHIAFALTDVIDGVVSLTGERAREKCLDLLIDLGADVPSVVCGDPARLRQILLNLVSNAVKFTAAGEVIIRVSRGHGTNLTFSVIDTGIGIHADAQKKLFTAFTQADSSTTRQFGGTGLGLAICRHLVELMGGNISLDSQPGRGSTFFFMVPMPPGDHGNTAVISARRLPSVLAGRRVLVLEPSLHARQSLVQMVTRLGGNGEGIASLDGIPPLAISAPEPVTMAVVDMDLTRALDAILAVRQLWPAALIITIEDTGHAPTSESAASVRKPVRFDALYRACERALGVGRKETPPTRRAAVNTNNSTAIYSASTISGDSTIPADTRILVVEDNLVNQKVVLAMLSVLGHAADLAGNGNEAIARLRAAASAQTPYDLVFMDCQMPEMDGFTTTGWWRHYEREHGLTRVPIIALTANAMNSDRDACLAAGMDDFLSKPLDDHTLASVLERWLDA